MAGPYRGWGGCWSKRRSAIKASCTPAASWSPASAAFAAASSARRARHRNERAPPRRDRAIEGIVLVDLSDRGFVSRACSPPSCSTARASPRTTAPRAPGSRGVRGRSRTLDLCGATWLLTVRRRGPRPDETRRQHPPTRRRPPCGAETVLKRGWGSCGRGASGEEPTSWRAMPNSASRSGS